MGFQVGSIAGTFRVYDLWQRDDYSSNRSDILSPNQRSVQASSVPVYLGGWGKDIGVFTKSIPNVTIRAHSVKVWKLLRVDSVGRREDL